MTDPEDGRAAGKRTRAGTAAPRCEHQGRDDGGPRRDASRVRAGRVRGDGGGPGAAPEVLAPTHTTVPDGVLTVLSEP